MGGSSVTSHRDDVKILHYNYSSLEVLKCIVLQCFQPKLQLTMIKLYNAISKETTKIKIRGGWRLCPQTPSLRRLGASPPHPGLSPPLRYPVCATRQTYKILLPPPKFWAGYAPDNRPLAQLQSARFRCGRSEVRFPGRSNRHSVANDSPPLRRFFGAV